MAVWCRTPDIVDERRRPLMLDLPEDLSERRRLIAGYLTTCRVASLCRTGDRIVELAYSRPSALLPLLLRQAVHPQSLTVLHDAGAPTAAGGGTPFPVTRRIWDGASSWPVAGPFDLMVDALADLPTASVLRTVERAAALLTLGGRLALVCPASITDLPEVLRRAGFTVDEVHGVELPERDEQVERVMSDRFGSGSVELYRAMRFHCEPEFVRPVVATGLAEDAATVLRICRRTRPGPVVFPPGMST